MRWITETDANRKKQVELCPSTNMKKNFSSLLILIMIVYIIVSNTSLVFAHKLITIENNSEGLGIIHVYLPIIIDEQLTDNMVYIPAGEFQMGCDPAHNDGYPCNLMEIPLHTVFLDAYYIDKTEVTNVEYELCVSAGSCTPPSSSSSYTRVFYFGNPQFSNYPVININWYQADSYCAWTDKRLPTEAEWEKAARGSINTRAYPWGDSSPTCSLANHEYFNGTNFIMCVGDTNAVGSYILGASPYGLLDMAGNVREWVNDWYSDVYYHYSPYVSPIGPSTGDRRVIRGGGWADGPRWDGNHYWGHLRTVAREFSIPEGSNQGTGFRCVYSP
jgi:formylglycine-generating enzyme required for sulfatase activity